MTATTLIQRLRALEADHGPDGWPAIKMRDVSALLDAIEQQAAQIAEKDRQLRAAKIIIAGLEERALHQSREFALLKTASADVAGEREANALLTSEVEALRADAERLRASAEKVILWNRDHANDQYGDPDKAEAWACVRELRAALRQEQPAGEGEK